jgi:hypothetical protein
VAVSLEDWKHEHFAPDELADPAVGGDGADPDGDGLDNLAEYALGLDPRAPDATTVAGTGTVLVDDLHAGEESYFTVTFVRRRNAPGLRFVVEACADLAAGDWVGEPTAVEVISRRHVDAEREAVTVLVRRPSMRAGAGFARLRLVTGD